MSPQKNMLAALALMAASASASKFTDMGSAAFLWPNDREWSDDVHDVAPCGTKASPGNRTDFPMKNGQVSLVAQDDSWSLELSIAYSSNPTSNDDFDTLIDASAFHQMDIGHTCVSIPDVASSVSAGDLATLQIKYIAEDDKTGNETYYACADIKFVEVASFDTKVPCFNATESDDENSAGAKYNYHGDADEKSTESKTSTTSSSSSGSSSDESKSGSSGLSMEAIAGIVVGVVVGVSLLILVPFFLYRHKKNKRQQEALKQASGRGVSWDEEVGKNSMQQRS